MRLFNKKLLKVITPLLVLMIIAVPLFQVFSPRTADAQPPLVDPAEVRAAVLDLGMGSLSTVILNDPPGIDIYVRVTSPAADATTDPATPAPPQALIDFAAAKGLTVQKASLLVLGKALFWDQQTGSDGQACASCHFAAGVDTRTANSLNPGSRNTDPTEAITWNPSQTDPNPGPNYQLTAGDFPFHELADPLETNYMNREILFDTDDVVGSIGTFHATYAGSPVPDYAAANATGVWDTPAPAVVDPIFNIDGQNTRSNGPRQAASTVNAVFNFRNFWDGRADNAFNGKNGHGIKDNNALIYWNSGSTLILDLVGGPGDSSLASQALFPPDPQVSDEMSFAGRSLQDLGRKMLRLTSTPETPAASIIPLGAQIVDPGDSVLGPFVNDAGTNGGRGLNLTYENLIQWAFLPQYWNSRGPNDPGTGLPTRLLTPGGYHLMEQNFPVFWGLAIQEYETILRADQTPFDRFMDGDDTALTQNQLRGLLTYIHTEEPNQQISPLFDNLNFGACQLCHSGPELTENSLVNVPLGGFVTLDMTVKMDHNRELAIVAPASNFDIGFSNVGTRPNREDIGIGGDASPQLPGIQLSMTRGANLGQLWAILFAPLFPAKPNPMRGSNVDGAFKIPHLRNIEMTGPYFHHGGSLTLKQAVQFYARHGDFADVNDPNIDVGLAMVQNVGNPDIDMIIDFLMTLTDERVRWEQEPFDHPQLFIPNGHPATPDPHAVLGPEYRADIVLELPAVGAGGRSIAQGPLPNFMGISSTPVADPIPYGQPGYAPNDHFDQ